VTKPAVATNYSEKFGAVNSRVDSKREKTHFKVLAANTVVENSIDVLLCPLNVFISS
jgi:hypothetical protein